MTYNLTEVHRYHIDIDIPGTEGTCEWGVILPGPIHEAAARRYFGKDFDRAIKLGVLVPMEHTDG